MVLAAIVVCLGLNKVHAEPYDNINVVFVLDRSYSMNATDKNNIVEDLLELFANLAFNPRVKTGVVVYNDTAEIINPLMRLHDENAKIEFRRNIAFINRTGRTDTGLGLKKGWEILNTAAANQQSLIILITDGEIDINPLGKRQVMDSLNDIAYVVGEAKTKQIPIYTIAMGNSFDHAQLKDISQKTNASFRVIEKPQDMPEIIGDIFRTAFKTRFVPVASIIANGEFQEATVNLPDSFAAQANILLTSSLVLRETHISPLDKNMELYQTKYCSSTKISSPEQKQIKIMFKSDPESIVKVNLISHYDLSSRINFDKPPIANQPVTLGIHFTNNLNELVINDKKFYDSLESKAYLKNLSTGAEVAISPQTADNGIFINHIFNEKGQYLLRLEPSNKISDSFTQTIQVGDSLPPPPNDGNILAKISVFILLLTISVMIYYREREAKNFQ